MIRLKCNNCGDYCIYNRKNEICYNCGEKIDVVVVKKIIKKRTKTISKLALEINIKTKYAAFFDFSGHVTFLSFMVCKNKTSLYNERIMDFLNVFELTEESFKEIVNQAKELLK